MDDGVEVWSESIAESSAGEYGVHDGPWLAFEGGKSVVGRPSCLEAVAKEL